MRVYDRPGPPLSESISFRSEPAIRRLLYEPGATVRENAAVLANEVNLQGGAVADSSHPAVIRVL